MHRLLSLSLAAVFTASVSAADSELQKAAKAIQAVIPEAKLTKAPPLDGTGGRPTYLVSRLGDRGAWTWPAKDKEHVFIGLNEAFKKWAKSVSWRNRVLLTQFDDDSQAEAFVLSIGTLPCSQLGIQADRRGSIVTWGDVNVVAR